MIHTSFAIIWDMDGVLVDSAGLHYRAWRQTIQDELRRDMSEDDFNSTFGLRNSEMLRDYLGYELSEDAVNRLADRKEALYRDLIHTHGLTLLPGVLAWLKQAHTAGWRQAVASSAPRANVEAVVDAVAIRRYFSAMISAEDVHKGKPDPEVFLAAARKVDVTPGNCIVIEDAPFGILGARQAGMRCIGVLTTHPSLDADIVINCLEDIRFEYAADLVSKPRNATTLQLNSAHKGDI